MRTLPGTPNPLGATWDGTGVNFALYSEHAKAVELCLFDPHDREARLPVERRTGFVWHAFVEGLAPGQRYGYRVAGPYDPAVGLRFNPHAVLLDPYAKALDGVERWERGCFAYSIGNPQGDLRAIDEDVMGAPRGVVVDGEFDWEGDVPLRTPLHRSVIYEAHVRGLTKLHPEVPEHLRGTYAGVCHPAILRHLRDLGITAIELMPVHAFVDDKVLLDRGLRNYWGYSTLGFFAPDIRYRSGTELGSEVREFKEMVKALHRAGIEVILDVVYNHTAEGNHLGPTFSFKGIDNPTYYRLVPDDPRYYFDYTGTGNTFNVRHPQVLALIMDSLRYWAIEMHVDGFRFDLASTLARQLHEVDRLSSFFTLIHQSPQLSEVKLIAEPWDVGDGGYQVGNFPVRWAEWNGRYRDSIRALWKGEGGKVGELGYCLTGSSDLYQSNGRAPGASINLVTAHDGLTLNDLVTYDHKHNDANGEDNRDGNDDEHSWNCGVEGPTEDEAINALRRRQRRNLLATLLLSQGTPMIVAGDEFGRSQHGNNNAYCQDNETSWLDWRWTDEQRALYDFTRRMIRIRARHPALRRSKFFQGRPIHGSNVHDLLWFRHDGAPMSDEDWSNPFTQSLAMFLAGRGINDVDEKGRPLVDDNLFIFINASHVDLEFVVPAIPEIAESWQLLVDTNDDRAEEQVAACVATKLVGRSLKFFRAPSRVIRRGGASHTLGSTYRLQLIPSFGFRQAAEILGYLAKLGVTDVYTSPIFQAVRASTHGYDVVDWQTVSDELGGGEAFEVFSDAVHARGMGLVVDWVPNHMGIAGGQNRMWEDVLENGPSSLCAEVFDIDWQPPKPELRDRVLLPILGDSYGAVLERGELRLTFGETSFFITYSGRRLPIGPRTLVPLIEAAAERTGLGPDDPSQQELESILSSLRHLPTRHETSKVARRERAREKEVFKRRIGALLASSPAVATATAAAIAEINGTAGASASFDALDALLREQSYRLASWRVATEEINYRRFFDINELAAVRMELSSVFESAHRVLFQLLGAKKIDGLRLDHTDGLYDPLAYFESLQGPFRAEARSATSPDDAARPLPILVEKILEPGERLPAEWPVDGTTGYEFTFAARALWVDRRAERELTRIYQHFTGDMRSFEQHVYESKQATLLYSLSSEVNMLARMLERMASESRTWRDLTLISLTRALTEVLVAFPVYRTYLREGVQTGEHDERTISGAIADARRRNSAMARASFDFIEQVLQMRTEGGDEERKAHGRFALRFQQLTGPVMAKSVEDTAFYRYARLLTLNEVGGAPERFGTTLDEFHAGNVERARSWPLSMTTISTHDTKRGEDTSARIAVLTEIPGAWEAALRRWHRRNEAHGAPSRVDEYVFYQSLVGAWPYGWDGKSGRESFVERLATYMAKSIKEAKVHTSWTNPDESYDQAVHGFVHGALGDDGFVEDVRAFVSTVATAAATNGLSQTVLRFCVPGIADTYQGSETWNQSLVDPDNRRPVDYASLAATIRSFDGRDRRALAPDLLAGYADGAVKVYVTQTLLLARKAHRDLFLHGDYHPLGADERVVAFERLHGERRLLCFTPRLVASRTDEGRRFPVGEVWGREQVRVRHAGRYRELFTGRELELPRDVVLADIFDTFPVAVFISERA